MLNIKVNPQDTLNSISNRVSYEYPQVKDDADKLRKLFNYIKFSCKEISFISNIKFFFYLLYLVNKITRKISNQKIFKPK